MEINRTCLAAKDPRSAQESNNQNLLGNPFLMLLSIL